MQNRNLPFYHRVPCLKQGTSHELGLRPAVRKSGVLPKVSRGPLNNLHRLHRSGHDAGVLFDLERPAD
jgi:hypothetical protein